MKERITVILAGVVIGISALLLTALGNPANMGFCIACFLRDTAGALGLHQAAIVQYARPEIIGIVIGALIMALSRREYNARGGSSPAIRFILGFCMMIGALVFLGCPLRMLLRIAGGDLNAIVGLVGFAAGIGVGVFFLNKGFSLKRAYPLGKPEGMAYSAFNIALLIVLLFFPMYLLFSATGPGSMHAPILIALVAGLIVGGISQLSRFCMAGGIRDVIMFKDIQLISGFLSLLVVVFIGNLILGHFNPGFAGQPIAHSDGIWNFLGMSVVGYSAVLLGGCPLRQLILAGEGSSDSAITVVGLMAGAAAAHNLKIASTAAGTSPLGPTATVICLIVITVIALTNIEKFKEA